MPKDFFDVALDITLKHVSELGNRADRLAEAIYGLLEGGDPEDAAALLDEYGYTDENGEWIYGDDE